MRCFRRFRSHHSGLHINNAAEFVSMSFLLATLLEHMVHRSTGGVNCT